MSSLAFKHPLILLPLLFPVLTAAKMSAADSGVTVPDTQIVDSLDVVERVSHHLTPAPSAPGSFTATDAGYLATVGRGGLTFVPHHPGLDAPQASMAEELWVALLDASGPANRMELVSADRAQMDAEENWLIIDRGALSERFVMRNGRVHYEIELEPAPPGHVQLTLAIAGMEVVGTDDEGILLGTFAGAFARVSWPRIRSGAETEREGGVQAPATLNRGQLVVSIPPWLTREATMPLIVSLDIAPAAAPSGMSPGSDSEGIVISSEALGQERPVVSVGVPYTLVVWDDKRSKDSATYRDIYAARIDSEGIVLDPAGIPICTVTGDQNTPSVTWNGEFWLVVWSDGRYTGEPIAFRARVGTDGRLLEEPDEIYAFPSPSQLQPVTAWSKDIFYVAWLSQIESDDPIAVRGTWFDSEADISNVLLQLTEGKTVANTVISGANDGRFIVAYNITGSCSGCRKGLNFAKATTTSNYDTVQLVASSASYDVGVPRVVWQGSYHLVVFTKTTSDPSTYDFMAIRVRSDGTVLSSQTRLFSVKAVSIPTYDIGFDGRNLLLVWTQTQKVQNQTTYSIDGQFLTKDGALLAYDFPLSTSNQWFQLDVDGRGGAFFVTWSEKGQDYDVHGAIIRYDSDGDGVPEAEDNCTLVANPDQADADQDRIGDSCDVCVNDPANDLDGDGRCADADNCLTSANPDQKDSDRDGEGDVCDTCPGDAANDADEDGRCAESDNCPSTTNPDQKDRDADGRGDACDVCPIDPVNDTDQDGHCADVDNCPATANGDQKDSDADGFGDNCDPCPVDPANDADNDGRCADADNCPLLANASQADQDRDGIGDGCDVCPKDAANDVDDDDVCGNVDNCPTYPNSEQDDSDGDGRGDACDICEGSSGDTDDDGICDSLDNCPSVSNPGQQDRDSDDYGDGCDVCPDDTLNDEDRDGACADVDNCPMSANADQLDTDLDGRGDVCDICPGAAEDDGDHDGVCADEDNCIDLFNPDQQDSDVDGRGDACETCVNGQGQDIDGDDWCDDIDNCPAFSNPNQLDTDSDGLGDVCESCPLDPDNDKDEDGICGNYDNCPEAWNPNLLDADQDGVGDSCDLCPIDPGDDSDGDNWCRSVDNCPDTSNSTQSDADRDGRGDACDFCPYDAENDGDQDGMCADQDNCRFTNNADQSDRDLDGQGDACDPCPGDSLNDVDQDVICGDVDNCYLSANADQSNRDGDSLGDNCDDCPGDPENDVDGDGVCGDLDNCPATGNLDQADGDGDGTGDACDDSSETPTPPPGESPTPTAEPSPSQDSPSPDDSDGPGCACTVDSPVGGPRWSPMALLFLIWFRRRRGGSSPGLGGLSAPVNFSNPETNAERGDVSPGRL